MQITSGGLGQTTPSWSPDGTEIAYFNVPIVNDTQRGRTQLAKRTVAGGAQDILYSLPGDADGAPAWSRTARTSRSASRTPEASSTPAAASCT